VISLSISRGKELTSDSAVKEKDGYKTTIFAVRTTIGREKTVQELIFNRLRTIQPVPDLKAILTSEHYRGYVFIEAILQHDVIQITSGVPHVKGKVVGSIPFESIEGIIKPERMSSILEEGDIVEIISGFLANSRAKIVKIPKDETKEEITVQLLDQNSSINSLKLPADSLKLVQKAEKTITEYVINDDKKMVEEEIGTTAMRKMEEKIIESEGSLEQVGTSSDNEKGIASASEGESDEFDDFNTYDFDSDENLEDGKTTKKSKISGEDDDSEEDDDDWAKFMDY